MKNKKEDPTVEISGIDFFVAQNRWVSFWGDQQIPIHSFGAFLGLHKRTEVKGKHYRLRIRQSAAKKIHKLCSTHWYTILKAYQIKKFK